MHSVKWWVKKVARRTSRIYELVEKDSGGLAALIIMLLTFLTVADIIGRFAFRSPVHGAYEVSSIMLAGIVFLSLAYVQSKKKHVSVEMATSWMPPRIQLALTMFGYALALPIMAVMTWQSGLSAWVAWVTQDYTTGVVRIPLWPGKILVPFGVGLLSLRLTADLVQGIDKLLHRVTE